MEIKKKFYDLINAANANNNNVNIYMFIKDCAFRFVFEHMNSIDEKLSESFENSSHIISYNEKNGTFVVIGNKERFERMDK